MVRLGYEGYFSSDKILLFFNFKHRVKFRLVSKFDVFRSFDSPLKTDRVRFSLFFGFQNFDNFQMSSFDFLSTAKSQKLLNPAPCGKSVNEFSEQIYILF